LVAGINVRARAIEDIELALEPESNTFSASGQQTATPSRRPSSEGHYAESRVRDDLLLSVNSRSVPQHSLIAQKVKTEFIKPVLKAHPISRHSVNGAF
jgi:hypothetical protein